MLPLTELCRTIRRDVRAISSYPVRGRDFSVPTILRKPPTSVVPPESFRQMRQRAVEEAAAEEKEAVDAAAGGGQGYLRTTSVARPT